MQKVGETGKSLLTWGALALIVWAGWELAIRVDAMAGPLTMFYDMAVGEKIGFFTALKYVKWEILAVPGYLLGCVILGILAIRSGRRYYLSYAVIPLALLAGVYATRVKDILGINLWQKLKLIPLLMIIVGSVLNIALHQYIRKVQKERPGNNQPGVRRFQ